jgi:molybdopterin molybdotransferase
MISLDAARDLVSTFVFPLEGVEVDLGVALGRVLCEPVVASEWFPDGDRGMMDGYAIGDDDGTGIFRVLGEVQTGAAPMQGLEQGEALRIFTGGLVPAGGRRVVPQECVVRNGEELQIVSPIESDFIRRMGCEAVPGDRILAQGARLGAAEIAILAQVGCVKPKVTRVPVIRHVATGNELVAPESVPALGQIRDSNSNLIAALVESMGLSLSGSGRVMDDPRKIAEVADSPCDVLLISGGASVGKYDYGASVLKDLGFTIHFDQVNLRPGKPLTFGTRGPQVAFVIPGNPVSHFVTFQVVIRLALEILAGRKSYWEFVEMEVVGGELLKPHPRETLWPAHVFAREGKLKVRPHSWSSSGDSFSLANTNALIRVSPEFKPASHAPTLLLDFF